MNYTLFIRLIGYFYVKNLWNNMFLSPLIITVGTIMTIHGYTNNQAILLVLGIIVTVVGVIALGNALFGVAGRAKAAYRNQVVNQVPFRYRWTTQHIVSVTMFVAMIIVGFATGFPAGKMFTGILSEVALKGCVAIVLTFIFIKTDKEY